LAEISDTSYRRTMATTDNLRSTVEAEPSEILVAGVPWPVYKVVALAVGLLVLVAVGIATASAAPAVLAAAAAGTVVWLGLSLFHRSRR
jgi:hypothetical protein